REAGPGSFYAQPPHQKPRVMTPAKVAECANHLATGLSPAQIARQIGIIIRGQTTVFSNLSFISNVRVQLSEGMQRLLPFLHELDFISIG
ncbi:MAG: hypothetical protein KJ558_05795, partial [Gammaproteobacteria bacterium]|nr:hypothetical protein [Gammaproteobacteria bacterium]MBU1654329.1 hypothetical protein [Gammaproteobacteria bacterium]MBU1961196.1 hypothetical protein [Gammaproteobacteria bacterium]